MRSYRLTYYSRLELPTTFLNSSPPSAAYMRQWIHQILVPVIGCRLFCAEPLLEQMLTFCQLDPLERSSAKFEFKYEIFLFMKMHLKMSSAKMAAILSRGR